MVADLLMLPFSLCCNELENPIGIETKYVYQQAVSMGMRCNELENPIGIETCNRDRPRL